MTIEGAIVAIDAPDAADVALTRRISPSNRLGPKVNRRARRAPRQISIPRSQWSVVICQAGPQAPLLARELLAYPVPLPRNSSCIFFCCLSITKAAPKSAASVSSTRATYLLRV
jgi:hypothetical protein